MPLVGGENLEAIAEPFEELQQKRHFAPRAAAIIEAEFLAPAREHLGHADDGRDPDSAGHEKIFGTANLQLE